MNNKLVELSKKFADIKAKYDEQEKALKETTEKWNEVEQELLEAMIEEGVNSFDVDKVGKFSMRTKNYLSVNAANKEQFFEYLKESGNGHLLKLDVNPRTLTAFLGEHLEALIEQNLEKFEGDVVTARDEMLNFLNKKGANYFTKRDIAMKATK